MKKTICTAALAAASFSSIASGDFSFDTKEGTVKAFGKIGQTVFADALVQRKEAETSVWSVYRVAYQCKLDAIHPIASILKVGQPDETWRHWPGQEIPFDDHFFRFKRFVPNTLEKFSSNPLLLKSIRQSCSQDLPSEMSIKIPLALEEKQERYGKSGAWLFIPSRIKFSGNERDFWSSQIEAITTPVHTAEEVKRFNLRDQGEVLKSGATMSSMKVRVKCDTLETATMQYTRFDENGTPSSQSRSTLKASDFSEELPGSVGETIAKFVCAL